jgi:hypothetical protein
VAGPGCVRSGGTAAARRGRKNEMSDRLIAVLRKGFAVALLTAAVGAALAVTATVASAAGTCVFPTSSALFKPWADTNSYFVAPGGDFEAGLSGWSAAGGAGVVSGNESYGVGGAGSSSLGLPTTSSVVTTPTMCVTSNAPVFRMFVKNNGNLGHIDGQLAVYLNFSGADGKLQQVKIAALTVTNTKWTLSPKISFIQYLSTPLQSGYANISFTIRPNDTHGNWQIDDLYVDPYSSK